jgi:hypothetical protein
MNNVKTMIKPNQELNDANNHSIFWFIDSSIDLKNLPHQTYSEINLKMIMHYKTPIHNLLNSRSVLKSFS